MENIHQQTKQKNIKCSQFEADLMDKKVQEAREFGFNGFGSYAKFLILNAKISSKNGTVIIGK